MIKEKSAMFAAGPPVVERLGQKLTKNELGGWQIQLRSGAVGHAVDNEEEGVCGRGRVPSDQPRPAPVDHAVCTEEEAFSCARRFLSYLPPSIHDVPPRGPIVDDDGRREA